MLLCLMSRSTVYRNNQMMISYFVYLFIFVYALFCSKHTQGCFVRFACLLFFFFQDGDSSGSGPVSEAEPRALAGGGCSNRFGSDDRPLRSSFGSCKLLVV